MEPTDRWWGHCLIAGVLGVVGILLNRLLLVVGAAGLLSFLLASQYDFMQAVLRLDRRVAVTQSVRPSSVDVDEPALVTMSVTLDEPFAGQLRTALSTPTGVRVSDPEETTITLDSGTLTGETALDVEASVAGAHEFGQPALTVSQYHGRFTRTLQRGPTMTLVAQPRSTRSVYIGQGGEDVVASFGDHQNGLLETGPEFSDLRQYQPGDPAQRIDWKSTARLDEPYVQKPERDGARTMALLFDHRASMQTGEGETRKVDYAREVALTMLDSARLGTDSWGFYAVGEGGLTDLVQPARTEDPYERLQGHLLNLEPIEATATTPALGRSSRDARQAASRLAGAESAFARRLAPYFETTETYVENIAAEPLFSVVDTHLMDLQGTIWTVIFTDDTHRTELLEAAKLARHGGNRVLIFLTPTVLYEPEGVGDLDVAYSKYQDFEAYRRTLDELQGVDAFEIGPDDQLTTILSGREGYTPA